MIKIKFEINKEKEMPLLSRKRITASITETDKTPSRKELIKVVASNQKVKETQVIIKHIYTKFGRSEVKVIAHVYKNREDLEKFENKSLLKKHAIEAPKAEEKPAEEAPKEEPKAEEKPAEEAPKKEIKAEEKPAEPKGE